eukprot:365357-Chlamydomonas_euryale.AAC.12
MDPPTTPLLTRCRSCHGGDYCHAVSELATSQFLHRRCHRRRLGRARAIKDDPSTVEPFKICRTRPWTWHPWTGTALGSALQQA